jgi:hypothetical protein
MEQKPPFLQVKPTVIEKVRDSTWTLLAAIATIGPLAIPLVWANKRYSKPTKVIWTIAILLFTALLLAVSYGVFDKFLGVLKQYQELQNGMQ